LLPALRSVQPPAPAVAAPVEPPVPVVPPGEPRPTDDDESRYGIWPIALLGGGGALVVLGVVTGQLAMAERDELLAQCPHVAGGDERVCPSDMDDDKERLQRYAVAADVLWVSGAVLAGTGITLLLLDQPSSEPATLSAGCFEGGCGVRASGRF
jgi:hypothetical protein